MKSEILTNINKKFFSGYPTTRIIVQANVPSARFGNTIRGRKSISSLPGQLRCTTKMSTVIGPRGFKLFAIIGCNDTNQIDFKKCAGTKFAAAH